MGSAALGVLFYGIGDAHVKAEVYFRAAKPAVMLELLAALEEKDRQLSRTNSMLTESIAALKAAEEQIEQRKGAK